MIEKITTKEIAKRFLCDEEVNTEWVSVDSLKELLEQGILPRNDIELDRYDEGYRNALVYIFQKIEEKKE